MAPGSKHPFTNIFQEKCSPKTIQQLRCFNTVSGVPMQEKSTDWNIPSNAQHQTSFRREHFLWETKYFSGTSYQSQQKLLAISCAHIVIAFAPAGLETEKNYSRSKKEVEIGFFFANCILIGCSDKNTPNNCLPCSEMSSWCKLSKHDQTTMQMPSGMLFWKPAVQIEERMWGKGWHFWGHSFGIHLCCQPWVGWPVTPR